MKKKTIKMIIIGSIILVIIVLLVLIYINLFAGTNNQRNKDIKEYKLTNNEINSAQSKIKELEDVDSVDIHTNNDSKIIKIVIILKKDVEFDKMKTLAKETLKNFSEKDLKYYDFEIFIDTKEESKIYPKIGYKFVSNEDFSW